MRKVWTERDTKEFHELWARGTVVKVMCAKLGICKDTLQAKRRELGLRSRLNTRKGSGKGVTIYLDRSTINKAEKLAAASGVPYVVYIKTLVVTNIERRSNGEASNQESSSSRTEQPAVFIGERG